jgi:hypothetical protein
MFKSTIVYQRIRNIFKSTIVYQRNPVSSNNITDYTI